MIGIAITIPAMYTAFSLFVIEIKRSFRIFYSGNENEDPRQEQGLPSNDEHAAIRGPPPARMHHGDGIPSQGTAICWMYFCNAIAWLFVALRAFWLEHPQRVGEKAKFAPFHQNCIHNRRSKTQTK